VHVQILGSRGIPSSHGGFETFAEDLALFLTKRQHRVTVYCQADNRGSTWEDDWRGIRRIHIPAGEGAKGTVWFDWKSVLHACSEPGVALTLGYNTAILSTIFRLCGHKNVMNMDGIEWKRDKWSRPAKAWFYLNEWFGARLANHLIADHPAIANHLGRHTRSSKISIIPYGSPPIEDSNAGVLEKYDLVPQEYYLLIARPEPENSILEIVSAFSNKRRKRPLVLLGAYAPQRVPYHARVLHSAGPDVRFLGPIYDRPVVAALRYHARGYFHGHRVGGTNPSLVESLAAGSAVIAHDNLFTRWVAGDAARYFKTAQELECVLHELENHSGIVEELRSASRLRHQQAFSLDAVLLEYEALLARFSEAADLESEVADLEVERPADLVPVGVRQTGIDLAWNGTREEAYTGAGSAAD
jgi:glycosyltransferase involved in cell wall biosynthesis